MYSRSRLLVDWLRFKNRVKCTLGLHDLVGMRGDPAVSDSVMPIDPRGRPGPNDSRRCNYCGSRWKGAYDGLSPFWDRTRGPVWSRAQKRAMKRAMRQMAER
jgi:hypothetical protein